MYCKFWKWAIIDEYFIENDSPSPWFYSQTSYDHNSRSFYHISYMQLNTFSRGSSILFLMLAGMILWFSLYSELSIWEEKLSNQIEVSEISNNSWQVSSTWSIDFFADDSYAKFVSPQVTYLKLDYVPLDLVEISSSWGIQSMKDILLRKEVNRALQEMARDFDLSFSQSLIVVSGYRSYDYQRWIETRSPKCITDGYCARAGHSEHQSGLAVDLFETSNQETFLSNEKYKTYFDWLKENAYKYGFINSYSQWVHIDGYHEEPWHWRYVGVELATKLSESWMSFTQYYNTSLKD